MTTKTDDKYGPLIEKYTKKRKLGPNAKVPRKDKEWDIYFLRLAKYVSNNSKCLSRKIGAVLVADGKFVVSTGYNGPPIDFRSCSDIMKNKTDNTCPRKKAGYKSGEGLHICPAAHAERNALILAGRNGIATKDTTLYCYCGLPCKDCLIEIINAGVKEIVCIKEKDRPLFYDSLSGEMIYHYLSNGLISLVVYTQEEVG